MRGSFLATIAVVFVACTATRESTARADQLTHPAGFTFALPRMATEWAQETRGDLVMLQDDTDKVPELQLFVFAVKKEGALADIVARLPTEVVRPGVELIASGVTKAKLVGATATETIADASVATGEMILNASDKAVFAVVQRKGRSLVLLAVPKDGMYQRGVSNFRAVIQGLAPSATGSAAKPTVTTSTKPAARLDHPTGFSFALPTNATPWKQQTKSDLLIASTGELELFVFPPKREGTLTELIKRLPGEVTRPGVGPGGRGMANLKVASVDTDSVVDAQAKIGVLTFDKDGEGRFAIVQRGGRSLILVGLPSEAAFRTGSASFAAVLAGLQPGAADTKPAVPPPSDTTSSALPTLPPLVGIKGVNASSTFVDRSKKDLYGAWRTIDYASVEDRVLGATVPETAWCEGKPDEGVGESVTIQLAAPTQLDAIRIAAGVWKTAKLFAGNNRITSLVVTMDGKTTTVSPAATRTWLDVPVRRSVSSITIKLAGVAKGKMNDSCLSGIELVRNNEAIAVVRGVDGAATTELPRALAAIQRALEAPGRAGLEKLLDFPFVLHDAAGFFEGAPGAVTYANWKAVIAACKRAEKLRTPASSLTCPRPVNVDDTDDRSARLQTDGPGQVEVVFPSHREVQEIWRLRWRQGAWRLAAIDYQ